MAIFYASLVYIGLECDGTTNYEQNRCGELIRWLYFLTMHFSKLFVRKKMTQSLFFS